MEVKEAAKGGNVIFRPGRGYREGSPVALDQDGALIFEDAQNTEVIRIASDGDFVRGVKMADGGRGLYEAMREWLKHAVVVMENDPRAQARAALAPGHDGRCAERDHKPDTEGQAAGRGRRVVALRTAIDKAIRELQAGRAVLTRAQRLGDWRRRDVNVLARIDGAIDALELAEDEDARTQPPPGGKT